MRAHAFVPVVALTCVLAAAAPASAAQTVEVTMNGYAHEISFPDGWRAAPEDGGVIISPPVGRYEGLQVIIVGVPKAQGAVPPIQLAKNLATSEKQKKTYLTSTEPDPMTFVGAQGAIITLDGVNPQGKRETFVYVVSMNNDTTYLLQANGGYDDLVANIQDIRTVIGSVRVTGKARPAQPAQPAQPSGSGEAGFGKKEAPPAPAPPAKASWLDEPPLPAPAGKAKAMFNDPMLGVSVARLDGWGVAEDKNGYYLEKRLGDKARVVASVWLGTEKFTGSAASYKEKVAPGAEARWDRFGGQDALVVARPATMEGGGDVLEVHVLRGDQPIVFNFRYDGGTWKERSGRDLYAEFNEATKVSNPGKGGGTVVVAGLVKVKLGKGWKLDSYGPGAGARFSRGDKRALVSVMTKLGKEKWACENGNEPTEEVTKVAGKPARRLVCPKDKVDPLTYVVELGPLIVALSFGDEKTQDHAGVASEFLGLVKL